MDLHKEHGSNLGLMTLESGSRLKPFLDPNPLSFKKIYFNPKNRSEFEVNPIES